jgi:hypothetical protein
MLSEEIKKYLPQYLTADSSKKLFEQLSRFPTDGTKDVVYTSALKADKHLFQGDGVKDAFYVDLPNLKEGRVPAILLSNTCDMNMENQRINPCRIMYAPLMNFDKYAAAIRTKYPEKAENHLKELKAQHITQALFLPKGEGLDNDSILFFDRTISLPLSQALVDKMVSNRLFTLSDFGFYLFLLKTSMHFTRIQEKVDRNKGLDMGTFGKQAEE